MREGREGRGQDKEKWIYKIRERGSEGKVRAKTNGVRHHAPFPFM